MKRWSNLLALTGLILLSAGTTDPPRLSLERPQALRSFVEGNNTFAFELYAKLGQDRGNLAFTGMTRRRPLFVQAVEQSSVVEVNEEGTEAASATSMSFGCAKSAIEPPRQVLHADHPFVFFIRENHTGTILFLGRVVDPTRS